MDDATMGDLENSGVCRNPASYDGRLAARVENRRPDLATTLDSLATPRQNDAMWRPKRLHPLLLLVVVGCTTGEDVETAPEADMAATAEAAEIAVVQPLPNLAELLRDHAERYPLMQAEDVYKLISQATRGPRHIFMGDNSQLDVGLYREIERMPPSPVTGEIAEEILDADRELVRVHLRPFLLEGGRADDLARAIGWTSLKFRPRHEQFVASLEEADRILPSLPIGVGRKQFRRYVETMWKKGYPAGHHSEAFALAYEPAYRIVLRRYLTDADFEGRVPRAVIRER